MRSRRPVLYFVHPHPTGAVDFRRCRVPDDIAGKVRQKLDAHPSIEAATADVFGSLRYSTKMGSVEVSAHTHDTGRHSGMELEVSSLCKIGSSDRLHALLVLSSAREIDCFYLQVYLTNRRQAIPRRRHVYCLLRGRSYRLRSACVASRRHIRCRNSARRSACNCIQDPNCLQGNRET